MERENKMGQICPHHINNSDYLQYAQMMFRVIQI